MTDFYEKKYLKYKKKYLNLIGGTTQKGGLLWHMPVPAKQQKNWPGRNYMYTHGPQIGKSKYKYNPDDKKYYDHEVDFVNELLKFLIIPEIWGPPPPGAAQGNQLPTIMNFYPLSPEEEATGQYLDNTGAFIPLQKSVAWSWANPHGAHNMMLLDIIQNLTYGHGNCADLERVIRYGERALIGRLVEGLNWNPNFRDADSHSVWRSKIVDVLLALHFFIVQHHCVGIESLLELDLHEYLINNWDNGNTRPWTDPALAPGGFVVRGTRNRPGAVSPPELRVPGI